jgi:hypothetical protein
MVRNGIGEVPCRCKLRFVATGGAAIFMLGFFAAHRIAVTREWRDADASQQSGMVFALPNLVNARTVSVRCIHTTFSHSTYKERTCMHIALH